MYTVEPIGNEKYSLGEGPYYDPRFNRLSWVDILGKRVFCMENGKTESYDINQMVGAAIPLSSGRGFLLALEDGLYTLDAGKISLRVDLKKVYKDYWRSNDAKADAVGRVWVGATAEGEGHGVEGNLYIYDPHNGDIRIRVEGTKISNGMAWNSDKKKFYFSDSAEHGVFVFDYDEESGEIKNRKMLFPIENGVPDGMTIDSEDNLWVAVWGGNRIEKRSGKTGELLDTINVPAKQVSSCCFGDADMKTLYITSAGVGQSGEFDGCLFKCRVDVTGVAPDYAAV
jgi:sugar lactone lactonase YvrE